MPGSGKTTLGQQVAQALNLKFVDLDKEIEKKEKATIPDIFQFHGEVYFREVESIVLKSWATSADSFIMATGGGTPCFHEGIDVINENGISVFLNVPVDELLKRTVHKTHRPLLAGENEFEKREKLKTLYAKRLGIYEKAEIVLLSPDTSMLLKALQLNM